LSHNAKEGAPAGRLFWGRARSTTISVYLITVGIFALAIFFLGDDIVHHIDSLESLVTSAGPWALILFILLYVILSTFFVPDMVFGIIAGTSFGFTKGLFALLIGSLCGAALQFALSRKLLKPGVEKFVLARPSLAAIQTAVRQQEFKLQFLIRLTPLNRTITNLMLGASGVGFVRFMAACVGLLPTLCLEVYIGYAGKKMVGIASHPGHADILQSATLIGGLVAAIIAMVAISRVARRSVEAATASSENQSNSSS
jgi:uncharacterized membrane protein YdjX (TVP38/TMEM64 family)